ncbi:hypothetical protein GCM10027446_08140 [Angustibacter peucedani]
MRLLHRPTVIRVLLVSAGLTLVVFTLAALVAPTLVDLFGAGAARRVTLVAGFAVRVLAGRAATRRTWVQGGDALLVLGCVVVGGLLGWLVFPGLVSLVGVVSLGGTSDELLDLLADLGLFLLALAVGALSARWGRHPA